MGYINLLPFSLVELIKSKLLPASDDITITLPPLNDQQVTVTIFNTVGQQILTKQLKPGSGSVNIDVSLFKNGVYLVQLQSNHGTFGNKKLIINH